MKTDTPEMRIATTIVLFIHFYGITILLGRSDEGLGWTERIVFSVLVALSAALVVYQDARTPTP